MDVGLVDLADEEGDHGGLAGPRLGLGDDAADGDDWDDGALLDGYAGRIWRGGDDAWGGHARRGAGGDCG